MGFLNETIQNGIRVLTASRDNGNGKPVTDVQITGNSVVEQKTQVDVVGGTVTFSKNIIHLEIYNKDTANDGIFMVNGISITVPKGDVFKAAFGGTPSPQVTVTGSTTYILTRYE